MVIILFIFKDLLVLYNINMLHLDYLMISNGGCDPFHYIRGTGGLGYKPSPPFMHGLGYSHDWMDGSGFHGGMVFKHINTGKLTEENLQKYNEQKEETNEFGDFIPKVAKDKLSTTEEKFKYFNNQLGDLKRLERDDPINKDEYRGIRKEIKKILKEPEYKGLVKKDYPVLKGSEGEESYLYNQHHKEAIKSEKDPSKVYYERGNISEKDITDFDEETGILRNLDRDKYQAYDSKDIDAFNDNFIKAILAPLGKTPYGHKYIDKKKLDKNDKDYLRKEYLSNFPIDVIKGDTIWELKSYKNKLGDSGKQVLNKTKIIGTDKFPIKYMKDNNGEIKIKNIYYKHPVTRELIPAFPDNTKGYNYYWMFNNKDKLGYTNPLHNKNFSVVKVLNKENTYLGKWEDKIKRKNKDGVIIGEDILINNEDIHKFPSRYSYEFNKKMMREKKK
jgi:hypothetical protein